MSNTHIYRAVLAVLLLYVSARAGDMQYVQTMHDTIPLCGTQADNPRSSFTGAGPNDCVIIDGPVVFGGTAEVRDVLVREGGMLVLRDGFSLKCRNLIVHKGHCDIQGRGTITVRDIPIDLTVDPKQWGNAVLCVDGLITASSTDYRQTWATPKVEVKAGTKKIEFPSRPTGWRAGDVLVFPDTRQPMEGSSIGDQTETATVSGYYNGEIFLSTPLVYDHVGSHGQMPDVGCLTQPIVIKSENPNGTRFHTAVTQYGHWIMRGVAFVEGGRTTTAPLGVSNQIGRYTTHFHHAIGSTDWPHYYQSSMQHCSFVGSPKWGCSIHNSYYANVSNCIAYDCAGGGIVTEEVLSYGFRIADNMVVAKRAGSGLRITTNAGAPLGYSGRNNATGDFWHNRCGFGLGSAMGTITGNRAYCCTESYGMAGFGSTQLYAPKAPGICASCDPANRIVLAEHMGFSGHPKRYPFLFDTSNNIAWGGYRGIETWSADSYLGKELFFPGLTLINCLKSTDIQDHEETVLQGWKILGDRSQAAPPVDGAANATFALDFKPGYRFGITCRDCEFKGHDAAYKLVNDDLYTRFERCVFDCPTINYLPQGRACGVTGKPWVGEWNDCTFNDDAVFIDGWYPKYDLKLWLSIGRPDRLSLVPIQYKLRPWKDGRNLDVYHYEQLPSFALPPIAADKAYGDWPAGVNTHQQLIERGMPIFGAAVPEGTEQFGKFYAKEVP